MHRPYPDRRRALRRIHRGYRITHDVQHTADGGTVEVHVFPGQSMQALSAELLQPLRTAIAARG